MKKVLSLVAIAALGITANATTLKDALANGKTTGEIRSLTILSSSTDSKEGGYGLVDDKKASAIALQLNYETADFYGFKAQVGFQAGHDFEIGNKDQDEPRITAEGANLYLANLSYTIGNTSIKVGKQLISTPLIAYSNINPMLDSFNALRVTNTDLKNTEITFYAIKDWYERYHAKVGNDRVTHFEDPTYSLYVNSKYFKDLTLEAQYFSITDDIGLPTEAPVRVEGKYDTYYGGFAYKLPTSMALTLGAFYSGANFDNPNEPNANMYGIKLENSNDSFNLKLAYTSVGDDNDHPGALGHAPDFFKYNGGRPMLTDSIYAGQDSYSALLMPKFGVKGLLTLFAYSYYTQSDEGKKNSAAIGSGAVDMDGASEFQIDLEYQFSGAFDGLSTRLQVAQINFDQSYVNDDDVTVGKLFLNYKF